MKQRTITIGSSTLEMRRTVNGVMEIRGDDLLAVQRGVGYAHATDRLMQLILTSFVAQGKVTEYLVDTQEAFAFDLLIRKLGFLHDIQQDLANIKPETAAWVEAYCEGVNAYTERHGWPLTCKFLKIKPFLWTIVEVMLVMKVHMYLGLAQLQERAERFIIQAIHDGVAIDKLKALFSPYLDGLDSSLVSLIKKTHLERPFLDEQMKFIPAMSNNWALSPSKSATGSALLCNDPHLQINRLPSIWYEVITHIGDDYQMGVTSPGFPGIVIGRSRHLSVGVTYGVMDVMDFFIEEVQGGCAVRKERREPLRLREEVINRKKEGKGIHYFHESSAGIIERPDLRQKKIEDGLYFALNWSAKNQGASPTLNALATLWKCQTVKEAQSVVREATFSFNWVFADGEGNIGYQQSGRLPIRKYSGLYPLPAWEEGALWQGFVSPDQLTSEYNPERGFVASANDNKNQPDRPPATTLPFASYRYQRICTVLSKEKQFDIEEMKKLQCDLYSVQAEIFMDKLRDLIPDTPAGHILRKWDLRYSKESKGAALFEIFYQNLLHEVFGKVFGFKAWEHIAKRHSLLVFIHGHFDRILLTGDESWFGKEGRRECFRRVLEKSLLGVTIPTWGMKSQFRMFHMLFEGRVAKWFGKGPYPLEGCRATVAASHLFREHKRKLVAGASYRFITDMGRPEAFTALCGGVSEKRFSKDYISDMPLWLNFNYKKLN